MRAVAYMINVLLIFFVFSIAGWCMEVALKYRQFGRFINRGFLNGPYLPIYGSGAALITLSVRATAGENASWGEVFLISFIVCGAVEYITSWYLEKRFHARWWDYSWKPMNLHGRVWIGNLILFGLGGMLIYKAADPMLFKWFDGMSLTAREIIAGCMTGLVGADYVASHFVMKMVKQGIESSEADNTEAISKEIRAMLADKSMFHRRFIEAYPEVVYRTDRVKARLEAIRKETERLKVMAEQRADELAGRAKEVKEQIASDLEPAVMIRKELCEKQGQLIHMIYDEAGASEAARALKMEIDEKTRVLEERKNPAAEILKRIKG